MKIEMFKEPGGIFRPASDMEYEKTVRFKTNELYTVEIKLTRSPKFHRKVFTFFNFCFQYWKGDNDFQDETKQFDVFRNHLTCLAGFYDSYVGIDGRVRVEAKSLSFGSMEQEEFESFFHAIIQAAITHVFKNDAINNDKLYNFM